MTGYLAVETERLRRVYPTRGQRGHEANVVALDDVTLSVRRGEIFGLLGMNGAGKSTLLQILATKLRPSAGVARVAGFDVRRYAKWVRRHAAVVHGGEHRLIERLGSRRRSFGQQQQVQLTHGFASRPKVLMLDQPTLGLDVAACGDVRTFIRRWIEEDATRTVVLSTHDMREADDLCDRVAILDAGRVLACETPSALRRRLDAEPMFRLETSALADEHAVALTGVAGVRKVTHRGAGAGSTVELVLQHDDVMRTVLTTLSAL